MIRSNASIFLFILLIALSSAVRAECYKDSSGNTNEVVGTLLGAAVGGLVGSQIGGGTGNKIAIGAGVLAGGLIGNRIGQRLDCRDIEYHTSTAQSSLETQRTGTTQTWSNPDSGHSGTVTPTKTYIAADGKPCRDFTQTISVDGQMEEVRATACRQEDGTWQIVDS